MQVIRGFDDVPLFDGPIVATVGAFDGVHGGHRVLLERLRKEALETGGRSVVLTFDPHPRVALGTAGDMLVLTPLDEKIQLMEALGIDCLIIIPFDETFSRIPAEQFLREYLIGRVGVTTLLVGYNHRFGADKAGDHALLEHLEQERALRVVRVEPYELDGAPVSSTRIRRLIAGGEHSRAEHLLGKKE